MSGHRDDAAVQEPSKGTLAAICAFSLWGALPVFWKLLEDIPVMETTAHRVVWTLALLLTFLSCNGRTNKIIGALQSPRTVLTHALAALCLTSNWLIYVWATFNDRILEGALGYYINPFLYILLGCMFLGEKHSRMQMVAIAVAAAGVALQFPAVKGVPWAALGLAISFAGYGMIRKKSPLGSFDGLTLEMAIIFPFALIYLCLINPHDSAFGSNSNATWLLVATAAATATPLLFFARGAKSISLSLLGILQFIGPTGQLLIGWLVYNEPMPLLRLLSFTLIWVAVIIYIISIKHHTLKK